MEWSKRIITELPLRSLWDDIGLLQTNQVRDLTASQLRELLRQGPIRFVVADIGVTPQWVSEADCFNFWRSEVRPHLAEPDQEVFLDRFPDGYCYFADEWQSINGSPIVVLQRYH